MPEREQFGAATVPDIRMEPKREVKGMMKVRSRGDHTRWLGSRRQFPVLDTTVRIGSLTGRRAEIIMHYLELDFGALSVPKDGDGTIDLPFTCLESTAGHDDVELKLY